MKYIIGALILILIIGSFFYVDQTTSSRDRREIKNYVESKGKAKIPSAWRDKVGNGI